MKEVNLFDVTKEKFQFLENLYNFNLIKSKDEDWGFELIYKNLTTGIKISYEYREPYFFITIYKLINGNLVDNPIMIYENTVLNGYCLDDLLSIKKPSSIIKPIYEYDRQSKYYDEKEGLKTYATEFSENLKNYAKDILKGDFSVFIELDKIVKNRLKN